MGRPYNTRRTRSLIMRMTLNNFLGIIYPMQRLKPLEEPWVCTDAVFHGLLENLSEFKAVDQHALDWNFLQCASTNDFLALCRLMPQSFTIITQ